MTSFDQLFNQGEFIQRHIGADEAQVSTMLSYIGAQSLEDLTEQTVPASILKKQPMALQEAVSEANTLARSKAIADKNTINKSYIGMGYYPNHTPTVILRNVLENPGWYTAYTPYQPEIAQGRLEALLNFQQMVMDLTAMEMANASLLDEGTAAARSEEHTSELQSRPHLVCRLLLEKKKSPHASRFDSFLAYVCDDLLRCLGIVSLAFALLRCDQHLRRFSFTVTRFVSFLSLHSFLF